ncbi:MAG: 6-phosphogluconolactonase [Pseudomonadota bacterium]
MITEFTDKATLQDASAIWIAERLGDALSRRGSAVFMASGGRTPGPIYEQLSKADLDWAKVWVGLTDERWVDAEHEASNGAMVQRTLLQNRAAVAEYMPMKLPGDDAFAAVDMLSELYLEAYAADVMLLGMGSDAHTLSWFQGGRGYEAAIDPSAVQPVAAVEAIESEVTGPHTLRMTLTRPCIAEARNILLLVTGEEKRHVFETAPDTSPVGILKAAAGRDLSVFYAK